MLNPEQQLIITKLEQLKNEINKTDTVFFSNSPQVLINDINTLIL